MGYNLLRFPIALLLILAAALKMQEMLSPLIAEHRGWHILLVQAELLLALWLLAGIWRRASWAVVTVAFAAFAQVSLFRALRGDESCGCFGAVQVNPWLTFTLDTGIVLLLLIFPPRRGQEYAPPARRAIAAVAAVVFLAIALPTSLVMWRYTPGLLQPDGTVAGDPRHIGLLPEHWVGRPFPLLPFIDIDTDLSTGRWSLMFYSHRCPTCHLAIQDLIEQSAGHPDQEAIDRIVLIEIPPHGPIPLEEPMRQMFKVGRLRDDREWYLTIPTVIRLQDGQVTEVNEGAYLQAPPLDKAGGAAAGEDGSDSS